MLPTEYARKLLEELEKIGVCLEKIERQLEEINYNLKQLQTR